MKFTIKTIKRLLNGQFARIPQIAALNAIALSAGYKDWKDFTQAKALREPARPEHKQNLDGPGPGPKLHSSPRFLIAGTVLIQVQLEIIIYFFVGRKLRFEAIRRIYKC